MTDGISFTLTGFEEVRRKLAITPIKKCTIHALLPAPHSGLEWPTLPVGEGVRHGG